MKPLTRVLGVLFIVAVGAAIIVSIYCKQLELCDDKPDPVNALAFSYDCWP